MDAIQDQINEIRRLIQLGDIGQAEQLCQAMLRTHPSSGDVHVQHGRVLAIQNRIAPAIRAFRQGLSIGTMDRDAPALLAELMLRQGFIRDALPVAEKGVEAAPQSSLAHRVYGTALRMDGQLDAALSNFDRAIELDATSTSAMAGRALALEHMGRVDEAFNELKAAADSNPDSTSLVLAFERVARKLGREQEAMDRVTRALDDLGRSIPDRIALSYRKGGLEEKLNQYDSAWASYAAANKLQSPRFDAAALTNDVDVTISTFDETLMKRGPRSESFAETMIFIVGMPRSGTSLVEQILASHPGVFGGGEMPELKQLAGAIHRSFSLSEPFPQGMSEITSDAQLTQLAAAFLQRVTARAPEAARITDKTPHNFMRLGLIDRMLPNARVIHCTRDPRDTCLSCFASHLPPAHDYASDLANLGLAYREYERVMDHWRSLLEVPMLEVAYEDVIADQEGMSRKIVEFAGLDWNDACLRFYETPRVVQTLSIDQVRQPIYSSSIGRWKHFESHLGPLIKALG